MKKDVAINFLTILQLAKANLSIGKSKYYIVPNEYKNNKQKFNSALSEAIFYDEVMLVEGQSEKVLFEYILQKKNPKYECKGKYILSVEGIGFIDYYDILKSLGIKCIVKTDNDIKFYVSDDEPKQNKCFRSISLYYLINFLLL